MKTSTLLTAALLSASCFAAPSHTAREIPAAQPTAAPAVAAQRYLLDVPVAPPAPDIPAASSPGPQRWEYLKLPKSRRLDRSMAPDLHQQT